MFILMLFVLLVTVTTSIQGMQNAFNEALNDTHERMCTTNREWHISTVVLGNAVLLGRPMLMGYQQDATFVENVYAYIGRMKRQFPITAFALYCNFALYLMLKECTKTYGS